MGLLLPRICLQPGLNISSQSDHITSKVSSYESHQAFYLTSVYGNAGDRGAQ